MKPTLSNVLTNASAHVQHQVQRIEAELDLAGQLCELHPDRAAAWRPLIEQAGNHVRALLEARRLEAVAAAVAEAERILAPMGKVAKTYTIHCVGHAHIDMNWMWSWPETVAVTVDTFSTVLRLMEQYPAFCFSQSQASTYAIVERHRPDLLQQIARRVKQGRWEVTASHWVEGDKNMAGGESLCRHLLYTRQYMQRLLDLKPEDIPIDWSPDTFGHAATVPTYLVRGGVKYLYLHRPGVHTPSKPGAFWWEGPDGSRVLVRNDMELAYNGVITPAVAGHMIKFVKFSGGKDYMFVFGVGDHGGGPTRRDILRGLDMATWPIFPTVKFSTTLAFYRALEKEGKNVPVITGELNTEFAGCYTTQSLIKKANRFAENRLIDAEVAAALAWLTGGAKYPAEAFGEGWRDTLFSHFHDILPGSGVHDTRTYTHGLFQKTMAATGAIEARSLRYLASLVDTSAAGAALLPDLPPSRIASALGAGVGFNAADGALVRSDQSAGHGPRPFVVFNPTTHAREEVVEATIWDNGPDSSSPLKTRPFSVRLPDGSSVPAQVLGGGGYWGHDYASIAFPVKVDGLGYSSYIVTEGERRLQARCTGLGDLSPSSANHLNVAPDKRPAPGTVWQTGPRHHCGYAPAERSTEGLENDFLRLDVDTASGGIRRLVDKAGGIEIVAEGAGRPALEYAVERPHGMTAWSIDNAGPVEQPKVTAMRRALQGPYKASIEVDLRICESELTLTYELRANDPRLYVHVKGVWFQRGTPTTGVPALSFALPLALEDAKARYEIPFGAIDRDINDGQELPALNWVQVRGLQARCDGLGGAPNPDVSGLGTPASAGKTAGKGGKPAGCLLLNDSKHGHSLDGSTLRLTLIRSGYDPDILPEIGQHEIHLAVVPAAGEVPVSTAIREGQAFNRALRVVSTDVHASEMPASGQFARVSPESAIVSGIKKAEKGDGLVVRVFNPTDRAVTAKVELSKKLLGEVAGAQEIDLLERAVARSSAKSTGNTVSVNVPGRGIASVSVKITT